VSERDPQSSQLNTLDVPLVGAGAPAVLTYAAKAPLRVLVRNIGGTDVFLSHDAETLTQQGLANTFQLPPATSEVIVLQHKQLLVAAAAGAGGLVSIAVSEALPARWMES
jgi:hypothetical protein